MTRSSTYTEPPAPTRSPLTRRAVLGTGVGGLLAIGAGAGWALDRFVIEHVEVANASTLQPANVTPIRASATGVSTADSYTSDTAQLTIAEHTDGTGDDQITWFVADVRVSDATIIRSAFANDQFGENIIANPSEIAESVGAVLAINGDYYGFRDTGIVIRNGVAYRDKGARQGLAFLADGSARLYDETATSTSELLAEGVWNTLSFGPGLVAGGSVIGGIDSVEIDTNVGNHSVQGRQPRTGIGVVAENHWVFVVADGRSTGYSRGVTMSEFAQIFAGLGAEIAYNLDGGGSSAMVFNSKLVNNPLGKGRERGTSDILYVAG